MINSSQENPPREKSFSIDGIKVVIFDMDDLMINSHPVHKKVFAQVLKRHGVDMAKDPLAPDEEAAQFGRKITDIFAFFRQHYNLPDEATVEKMNAEFDKLLIPTFDQLVEPMPGLFSLIDALKGKFQLVLASSARREKIDIVLKKLGLDKDTFSAVVSGEDEIERGKPAPDIFLKAAEKAGVTNMSICLVLEDATNGVEAAKAAGMKAIGVHNEFALQKLGIRQDLRAADKEVNNLEEVLAIFSGNSNSPPSSPHSM